MMVRYNDAPAKVGLEVFLEDFCKDRLTEFQSIEQALQKEDYQTIAEVAHKWKGFCDPYGFQTLTKYALELEAYCQQANASKVEEVFFKIKDYLNFKSQEQQASLK